MTGRDEHLARARSVPLPRDDTVAGWRSVAAGLLSPPCCAFHRNLEISAAYARLHQRSPASLKWAAMAALASHHIRRVLFPLRLEAAGPDQVVIRRGPGWRRLLTEDAHTIRETNNAIFDDIFWVHLAYLADDRGLERLRELLAPTAHYVPVLAAFEQIDAGRRLLASSSGPERRRATTLVWRGNLAVLDHEQRAVVQPHFDRLSRLFARLISLGATTTFEVRGHGREARFYTSFYLFSFTTGLGPAVRARQWPSITSLEARWRWLETSVVPRFQLMEDQPGLLDASLRRVVDDAQRLAGSPCLAPIPG